MSFGGLKAVGLSVAEVHRTATGTSGKAFVREQASHPPGLIVKLDIAYGSTSSERLDVYEPSGPAPRGGWPVILAVHGGGWWGTDKSQWGPEVVAQYAPLGYAVVVPDYTLSTAATPSWPAAYQDVFNASIWTHRHARAWRLNPDRIAALGESAGGELAALLGTVGSGPAAAGRGSAKVEAVISFYGPMDLTSMAGTDAEVNPKVVQYIGGTAIQSPAAYQAASPTSRVLPGDPPMMLIHGTADLTVPFSQSEEMARVLAEAGVPHELLAVEGAGHGFEFQPQGQALLPEVSAFLDQSMGPSRSKAPRHVN